jgi:hypothetical protein
MVIGLQQVSNLCCNPQITSALDPLDANSELHLVDIEQLLRKVVCTERYESSETLPEDINHVACAHTSTKPADTTSTRHCTFP